MRKTQANTGHQNPVLEELDELKSDEIALWAFQEYLSVAAGRSSPSRAVTAAEVDAHCSALGIGGFRRDLLMDCRLPMHQLEAQAAAEAAPAKV